VPDIPIQICPHVRPNTIYLMPGPVRCVLCEEDLIVEAERIKDGA